MSRGQLLTFKEALEGQILDHNRPDRVTIVKVVVDVGNNAPSVPTPPPVPSSSSTTTTTSTSATTRKRPLEFPDVLWMHFLLCLVGVTFALFGWVYCCLAWLGLLLPKKCSFPGLNKLSCAVFWVKTQPLHSRMHSGSCRGQGRRWPYHGFIRSCNLAQTCDCCSIPISCKECIVAG